MLNETDPHDDIQARMTPVGERSTSPLLITVEKAAIPFEGLPEGVSTHRHLTDTVEAALRCMGVGELAITLARKLADLSRKQDWVKGGRPIVWPANLTLQDQLGVTDRHLRRLILDLREAGALVMADSGNMKRYGRRGSSGHIVPGQAFGFDLSTWATCYPTFTKIVADHKADCAARADARKAAKIDKRKIVRVVQVGEEHGRDLASFRARAEGIWMEMEAAELGKESDKTELLTAAAHRMGLLRAEVISCMGTNMVQPVESPAKPVDISHEMSAREDENVLLKNTTAIPMSHLQNSGGVAMVDGATLSICCIRAGNRRWRAAWVGLRTRLGCARATVRSASSVGQEPRRLRWRGARAARRR